MICISTSHKLCSNVLHHAGPATESQYKQCVNQNEALLINGGLTAARKILFLPWRTEIEETELTTIEKVNSFVFSRISRKTINIFIF